MRRAESSFRSDIADWLDGRLGTARRARLERHLKTCAECDREWKALASVKAALWRTGTPQELPKGFAERLRFALDHEDAAAASSRLPSHRAPVWRFAAAVFGAVALAAALFLSRSQRPDLASSVLRDSARIASGRLPLELASDSPQAVSRFFSERRIGFPVPAESLEIPTWRLAGARAHSLVGHRSALSLFRNAGNRMMVCQMFKGNVAELPPGVEVLRRDGATLYVLHSSAWTTVFWQDGSLVCALASDIAEEEILRIALAKAVMART